MSGDVQPRKRNKDKKRKKDDEDTVKETPAPKAPSSAQAAKEPGDIQMHVHDDHGTGGHWCAKIVFFILLAGLGALIGLIIMENQGASDVDTPLSESRYAEYLTGWVDENRDHHHEEDILNALNELDDHDEEHGHDDHDDEHGDEEDDGTPYTEEEDHEDGQDEEDEDEEEVTVKLDDDEVEEIVATERKIREAEAVDAADDEDEDEDNNDDNDDEGDQADDDNDADNDGIDDDEDDNVDDENADDDDEDDNNDARSTVADQQKDADDDDDDDEQAANDDAEDDDNDDADDQAADDNNNDDEDAEDDGDDANADDDDDDEDGADADNSLVDGDQNDDDDDLIDDDDNDAQLDLEDDEDDQKDNDDDENDGNDDNDDDDENDGNDNNGDNDENDDNDENVDKDEDDEIDQNDDNDDHEDENDGDNNDDDDGEEDANDVPVQSSPNADDDEELAGVDIDDNDDDDDGIPNDQDDNNDDDDDVNDGNNDDADDDNNDNNNADDDLADNDDDDEDSPFDEELKTNALNANANIKQNLESNEQSRNDKTDEVMIETEQDDNDDHAADDEDNGRASSRQPQAAADVDDEDDDEANDDNNDDDDFDSFVDNDDGEEEYLAKLRAEQDQRKQQKLQQQEKEDTREESSLAVQILVGVALIGAARLVLKPPGGRGSVGSPSTTTGNQSSDQSSTSAGNKSFSQQRESVATAEQISSVLQERLVSSESKVASVIRKVEDIEQLLEPAKLYPKTRSVLDDFVNADPASQEDEIEIIEGNVILIEADDGELYSGDEYEIEEYDEEDFLEEIEEEEEEDLASLEELEEKKLEEQEREIGTFVPTTFEEFNAMYRAPQDEIKPELHETVDTVQKITVKPDKDSPLMKKKPPKGAVGKLIYGLHKDPIFIADDSADSSPGSGKGEAKSALEAMLSDIHSPPQPPPRASQSHSVHAIIPDPSTTMTPSSPSSTASIKILTTTITPVTSTVGSRDRSPAGETVATTSSQPVAKEKHVEFLLPGTSSIDSGSISEDDSASPLPVDNGSKENLFIPSDEFLAEEEYGDELVYEDEEYLRQYASDEDEEELYSDQDDEPSDVDDSELMMRLEEKYGKLEVKKDPPAEAAPDDEDEGSWTKIPSRPSGSSSYADELNRAKQHLDEFKNAKQALHAYESLLSRHTRLIPALVGKARSLDLLAEQEQSNVMLGEAIEAYRDVLAQGDAVDDETFASVAERTIDRIRFRGQYGKAVEVHRLLIERFDSEPKYRNQLAVTYLLGNRMAEAKAVLHETLMRWIDDGFALVHYGFVIKNHDKNMEQAVQYLREGIESGQEGTQDGRFYFHLGDALQRLGKQEEALEVYKKGAEKKLFLSMYQRSLYNMDSLKSRPFWTVEQTGFVSQLELIRSQWTAIRDEGLKLLNSAGNFKDEAENLRDTGDWKQFELFFRGYRSDKNCAKAPLTCRLVEQFAAARSCKRGQVKFSVMHPGTHVWPHCGPTNCRIRAHLGLKVPTGTSIRVAEETRSWENGQWLIFDDSFEHEVWHNGTATRLVLIVDFWHPDLSEDQRRSLSPI
ncbi:dentin sialophosphoprotein isoform X2 [Uranotaenia lowii]|uniref:dentin sialophosphoprotein isoform X2 n=1 Tax=Uranotaenia lowii TaxID=190385 RepID=UPI002479BAAB|nr:dentin sialophosphoprotein isoform X2 [Uranotaenia lowii]